MNIIKMKKYLIIIFSLFFTISSIFSQTKKNEIDYLFVEALKNKYTGNINQSIFLLNTILKNDSNCSACFYELADIYLNKNEYDNAFYFIKRALNIDTSNIWFIKEFLLIGYINKKYDEIIKLYDKNSERLGNEEKIIIANVLLDEYNNKDRVKSLIDDLSSKNICNDDFYKLVFKWKFLNKNKKEAFKYFIGKEKEYENEYDYYFTLGEFYFKDKKYKKSYYFFSKAYEINKNGNCFIKIVNSLINDKNIEKAKNHIGNFLIVENNSIYSKNFVLNELIDNNNSKINSYLLDIIEETIKRNNENDSLIVTACKLYEKNLFFDKCLYYSENIYKKNQNNIYYYNIYLYYLFLNNKTDIIRSFIKERVFLNKTPFENYIFGYVLYIDSLYYQSKNFLLEALKYSNNDFISNESGDLLANIYLKENKKDSAFYIYEYLINNNIANKIILNNYAYYLAINNINLYKAAEMSKISLIDNEKNSTFLDTYAWICFKLKNYEDALKYIEKALKYSEKEFPGLIIEHYMFILYCNGKSTKADKIHKTLIEKKHKFENNINEIKCL